ncbi:hypothetical protein M758_7G083700 [Ceratodon purpureus]|nr:hypothetical protein M758_7G083700 [Ceratodon purpureus]
MAVQGDGGERRTATSGAGSSALMGKRKSAEPLPPAPQAHTLIIVVVLFPCSSTALDHLGPPSPITHPITPPLQPTPRPSFAHHNLSHEFWQLESPFWASSHRCLRRFPSPNGPKDECHSLMSTNVTHLSEGANGLAHLG